MRKNEEHRRRGHADRKEQQGTDDTDDRTCAHQRTCPDTVVPAARQERAHRIDHTTGEHQHAGYGGIQSQATLQLLWSKVHDRQRAGERAGDHQGRCTERSDAECTQIQHRVGNVQLTVCVACDDQYADHQQRHDQR